LSRTKQTRLMIWRYH